MKPAAIQMTSASGEGIRQLHRWLSIIFTITVVANFAVRAQDQSVDWITYAPLLPLALLLFTGLYLFALPYLKTLRATSYRLNRSDSAKRNP